jgi:sterol desaturase/sphingolipid hydroxylase (fatty acid hydroxylase superfamily)
MTLPSMLVVLATLIFLVLERVFPGRELPKAKGWYWRALLVNLAQLAITLATARLWIRLFGVSVFKLSAWHMPLAEGFVGWFIGTFFFYWWHVLRHKNGFWLVFHQIHHSPSRIEIATSFYKHPIEILSDAILSALVLTRAISVFGVLDDGGVLVQLLCCDRRILLPRKYTNTALAEVRYPDTGITFDTSSIRRS